MLAVTVFHAVLANDYFTITVDGCVELKIITFSDTECQHYAGITTQDITTCHSVDDRGVALSYRGYCSVGTEIPVARESVVFRYKATLFLPIPSVNLHIFVVNTTTLRLAHQ